MNKVMIIGTIPPPIGGVTIHLDRFLNLFDEKEYQIGVFDIKKFTLFRREKHKTTNHGMSIVKFFFLSKIVHIQISNNLKLPIAIIAKLFFKKVVYTHHNSRINNKLIWNLLNIVCDKVILVNDKSIDTKLIYKFKTEVIPAFLPPYRFEVLPEKLDDELMNFDKVISTNCSLYNLINGKHVYGFDLIVDAFNSLSQNGQIKNTVLVLVDPSATTKEFVDVLLQNKDFGTNKVLYISDKIDFGALVKKSNITIRATRTDGDSLSVRESLYFNVPIIASDVTVRPNGVIVFKNDDSEDLADKILYVLKNKEKFYYEHVDYGEEIINVYKKAERF